MKFPNFAGVVVAVAVRVLARRNAYQCMKGLRNDFCFALNNRHPKRDVGSVGTVVDPIIGVALEGALSD